MRVIDMGKVSNEDKDGFINLNVRVHRDDIIEAVCAGFEEDTEDNEAFAKTLTKKRFKEIAQIMADHAPFCGGDGFEDSITDAVEMLNEREAKKKK